MKARTTQAIFILVLGILICVGGCATDKMAYISKEYEIYGTWINPDIDPASRQDEKIVFHIDGRVEYYPYFNNSSFVPAKYIITNKWIDSRGNVWYTIINDMGVSGQDYGLCKISDSGKTLEISLYRADYPKDIDTKTSEYHILYRQE